ncbi:MAG: MBL fold metallo-hydrolase [Clostridia bacterium]|nr:MBL fold metallo-hydrolase [Clostridia bacterium]
MNIKFFGAARSVTGSCHMLSTSDGDFLIDCGMRQGQDKRGEYGEDAFPFDPSKIKGVLLSHAHIDHSGLIPLLYKRGFTGNVLCTSATSLLATIMLPDSGHIQEQDAQWQTKKNLRAGKSPVDPLYTVDDARNSLKYFRGVEYGDVVELTKNIRVCFRNAGHLLGSAVIEIWVTENSKTSKIVFSGDIGRADRPIIEDPAVISDADYVVMEGTYGNRNHGIGSDDEKENEFREVLSQAIRRGGNVIIPSFAIGRTQEILYYIKGIMESGTLPELEKVSVYIDSPLGIEATKVYERCVNGYYDEEALALSKTGSPFELSNLNIAQSADESKLINVTDGQKIIISSSGMCDAGRIRHHLKHNLYKGNATVIFAGYQAQGTLGRSLLDGVKKVRLFGEEVRVNAKVVNMEGFSGHAGKDELLNWVSTLAKKPRNVFLVHGEEDALASLGSALEERGFAVTIPHLGDSIELDMSGRPEPAQIEPVKTITIESTSRDYAMREQIERLESMLSRAMTRRSPDMELKLTILQADLKSLADKWDELIK